MGSKRPVLPPPQGMWASPEEPIVESFSRDGHSIESPQKFEAVKLPPIRSALSPPASPEITSLPAFSKAYRDAPLFSERSLNHEETPLFAGDQESQSHEDRPQGNTLRDRPFAKQLGIESAQHARLYFNDRLRELGSFRTLALDPAPRSNGKDTYDEKQKAKLTRPAGVVKTRSPRTKPAAVVSTPPSTKAVPKTPKSPPAAAAKATPIRHRRQVRTASPGDHPDSDKPKHKRAPPQKSLNKDTKDDDWTKLDDVSPDFHAILADPETKALRAIWRGKPKDMDDDPDKDYLHPQELQLASVLRLPAKQYLANKRRFFLEKVACLRQGKNFSKTAAQQACNIDVNKTSQMHEAFERSGMLRKELFAKHLE